MPEQIGDLAVRPRGSLGGWTLCCWYFEQATGTATRTVAVAASPPRVLLRRSPPSNEVNTPLEVEVMEIQVWSGEYPHSWHGAGVILDAIVIHNLAEGGR